MKTASILLVAAALALAGCGQSDNKSGANPTPASAPSAYVGALGNAAEQGFEDGGFGLAQ